MREVYKNPMLYYLLAPILVAAWPLLVRAVYLPEAERGSRDELALCLEGQSCVQDIRKYDPERMTGNDSPEVSLEFQYPKAIDRVANLCGIPSTSYNQTTSPPQTVNNKKTQNARVTLVNVGIVQAANFLSTIQSMYVNLKCERLKLTKKEGLPDQWDAEMTFWYTY
jgi:hypothetical protein